MVRRDDSRHVVAVVVDVVPKTDSSQNEWKINNCNPHSKQKKEIMRVLAAAVTALATLPSAASSSITLVTFDGAESTSHKFTEMNDPVMGGRSTGTFSVQNGLGIFDGQVVDVPSLSAPGFIKADTDKGDFPDISSCSSIVIEANTSDPYDGYR